MKCGSGGWDTRKNSMRTSRLFAPICVPFKKPPGMKSSACPPKNAIRPLSLRNQGKNKGNPTKLGIEIQIGPCKNSSTMRAALAPVGAVVRRSRRARCRRVKVMGVRWLKVVPSQVWWTAWMRSSIPVSFSALMRIAGQSGFGRQAGSKRGGRSDLFRVIR